MHFYKNLGSITFECQTPNLEIFLAQSHSFIIQSKTTSLPHTLFQQIASFYKQYLHAENVEAYCEENKGNALVITQCKRASTAKMDANTLCQIILEVITTVENISRLIEDWTGDISSDLLLDLKGRIIFVYIPCVRVDKQKQQQKILLGIMAMVNSLKNGQDVSSRLLAKKISKCSSLSDMIEEVNYFLNIYCSKKTNQNKINLLGTKKCDHNTSKRKLNLLRISQFINKSHSQLNTRQSFYFSETRKSTTAIHISSSTNFPTKRQSSSLHSSYRSMRPSNVSKGVSSHASCSSNFRIDQQMQEGRCKIINQKQSKNKMENTCSTMVPHHEQQKLQQKLKSKKTSRITSKPTSQQLTKNTLSRTSKIVIKDDKNTQIEKPNELRLQKNVLNIKQKPKKLCLQKNVVNIKQKHSDQQKYLDPKDQTENHKFKHQQAQQKQLKLKKIARVSYSYENINEDIGVIHLEKSNLGKEPSTLEYKTTIHKEKNQKIYNSKPIKVQFSSKPKEQSQKNQEKQLLEDLHNLDYIGLAVANTKAHVKKFEKVFWELPMFFLYRQFYLKRKELAQKLIILKSKSMIIDEIIQQNAKIEEAITKMIGVVNRKQKKIDPNSFPTLKTYLNLDKNINCSSPIQIYVREYIQSIDEAAESYSELLMHQVEVIDALLVCKGVKINSQTRNKLTKGIDLSKYLKEQKKILDSYQ